MKIIYVVHIWVSCCGGKQFEYKTFDYDNREEAKVVYRKMLYDRNVAVVGIDSLYVSFQNKHKPIKTKLK